MIRMRIPATDDTAIYKMVVRQLLPFTKAANPRAQASLPSIVQRLNGNDFTFVADYGGRTPVGFISGQCRNRMLFIDMLALDERYQGGGMGTLLMQSAEYYGQSCYCREAYLYVDEVNTRAQRFYMGKGYRIDSYAPGVRCYRMSKYLMH